MRAAALVNGRSLLSPFVSLLSALRVANRDVLASKMNRKPSQAGSSLTIIGPDRHAESDFASMNRYMKPTHPIRQIDSKPFKNQLDSVRRTALAALSELTGKSAVECRESYLFRDNRFCGVRFCLGDAEAIWTDERSELEFRRYGLPVEIPEESATAAVHRRAA